MSVQKPADRQRCIVRLLAYPLLTETEKSKFKLNPLLTSLHQNPMTYAG